MDPVLLILLIALPLLLVASGLFSGSETALFSLEPHERARLSRSGSAPAAALTRLLHETTPLLVTLLISNMVINVLYFTLSTVVLERWRSDGTIGAGGAGAGALATLLGIILFGEVLPKQVAARRPAAWAMWVAVPMLVLHRGLAPLRLTLTAGLITPLTRLIAPQTPPADLSAEELGAMLRLSQRRGVIDQNEQGLLVRVIELGRLRVRDLMVPRVDLRAHDINADPNTLTQLARETRLRHLPVYDGGLDQILGVVHSRAILLAPPKSQQQVRELLRPARFVPEIAPADVLLEKLRREATVFAVAVDEYGGTAGVITLEDLVEHIVGEIPGAFESGDEPTVEPTAPGAYRVDADLPVHDWAQWFGHNPSLAHAASGATTVGGLVLALLGRLPVPGDRVRFGNIVLTVDTMEGRRIGTLTLALTDSTPDTADKPSNKAKRSGDSGRSGGAA